MSTRELLKLVRDRGLSIILKDGRLNLQRPSGNDGVTDALLSVLKLHRDWIIELLKEEGLFSKACG